MTSIEADMVDTNYVLSSELMKKKLYILNFIQHYTTLNNTILDFMTMMQSFSIKIRSKTTFHCVEVQAEKY